MSAMFCITSSGTSIVVVALCERARRRVGLCLAALVQRQQWRELVPDVACAVCCDCEERYLIESTLLCGLLRPKTQITQIAGQK